MIKCLFSLCIAAVAAAGANATPTTFFTDKFVGNAVVGNGAGGPGIQIFSTPIILEGKLPQQSGPVLLNVNINIDFTLKGQFVAAEGYGNYDFPTGMDILVENIPQPISARIENTKPSLDRYFLTGNAYAEDSKVTRYTLTDRLTYSFEMLVEEPDEVKFGDELFDVDIFANGIDYEFTVDSAYQKLSFFGQVTVDGIIPAPEPASFGLLAFGFAATIWAARRSRMPSPA